MANKGSSERQAKRVTAVVRPRCFCYGNVGNDAVGKTLRDTLFVAEAEAAWTIIGKSAGPLNAKACGVTWHGELRVESWPLSSNRGKIGRIEGEYCGAFLSSDDDSILLVNLLHFECIECVRTLKGLQIKRYCFISLW